MLNVENKKYNGGIMKKRDKFNDVKIISAEGVINSLKVYFKEIWQKEIESEEMVAALELGNFTEQDLRNFSSIFRNYFSKYFGFNFPKLIHSLGWSTILLDSFSVEKKIISRLEKILWIAASDEDLEEHLIFGGKKTKSSVFKKMLNEFKENQKKSLSRTRKKSIVPKRKDHLTDDPVLQSFLASLDFDEQKIN